MAPVLKTGVSKGTVGSNPTLPAKQKMLSPSEIIKRWIYPKKHYRRPSKGRTKVLRIAWLISLFSKKRARKYLKNTWLTQVLLYTYECRYLARIRKSMVKSIRFYRDYSSFARKVFLVEPLEESALPDYSKKEST
jgi:hypothetical protein